MRITCPIKHIFIVTLFLSLIIPFTFKYAVAENCEDIQDLDDRAACYAEKIEKKQGEYESASKKLSDIRSKKDDVASKISDLASQLNVTQDQINDVQSEIDDINKALDEINANLSDRRGTVEEKTTLRNTVLRNYAKTYRVKDIEFFSSLFSLNGSSGFSLDGQSYGIARYLANELSSIIYSLNQEIDSFEKDKREAEDLKGEMMDAQNSLLAVKRDLDSKKSSAQGEYSDLGSREASYERELSNIQKEINELSSKQQAILNQKAGEGTGSVGEYEATRVSTPDPPFKPAIAAFSYGAYTHYKGMSQYGAKGRAEDGKSYEDIIKFYYKTSVDEKDLPSKICVEGYGNMDFQKYLYGLGEMPSDWPSDALKAQAVAARSYAYRYAKQGKCICTTQSCQVFVKSKSDNPPSSWKKAVDDTKDEVLKDESVIAYYSSTTGGYIENIGWDVDDSWPGGAYEKEAGSPWFRKAWYVKSYSDSSTCGRAHPWMTQSEMADILNSWVVWRKGSNEERDHISPVTTSCWGGDPYSLDKMAEKADKYGEKYSKVTGIDVDISSSGYTSKVILDTDKGKVELSGDTFKTVFNLRAPSYLSIKSRLYDFEYKK